MNRITADRVTKIRTIFVASPVVASMLLLSACSSGASSATGDAPELSEINIGISQISIYAAGYEIEDCMADKGLVPTFSEFAATPDRLAALVNGSVDMAFAGFTDTIKLSARGGSDLVVVANAATGGYQIAASPGLGGDSIADLEGKKIAVPMGTVQEMSLRYALTEEGIDPDNDVEMLQMGYADMPIALQRGDIDAFIGTAPYPAISIAAGAVEVPLPDDLPWGRLNSGLITTQAYLKSDGDNAQATVDCLMESTDELNSDPGTLKDLYVTKYKVPEDAVDILMGDLKLTNEVSENDVQGLIDTEFELGYIDNKPSVEDVLRKLTP